MDKIHEIIDVIEKSLREFSGGSIALIKTEGRYFCALDVAAGENAYRIAVAKHANVDQTQNARNDMENAAN